LIILSAKDESKLYCIFPFLLCFSGCTKNDGEFDPDEVLVTVNTDGWITSGAKVSLIIENRESTAISA